MSQIIQDAAREHRDAEIEAEITRARLHGVIRNAHRDGVPVTRLAKDAGVSRNTIYAILKGQK